MRKHLLCFDIVPFVRENWRNGAVENFSAIWLKDPTTDEVYVYFGRIDTLFCQQAEVDCGFDLGFTVREVYPESNEFPPPKGYAVCPERRVILRPQIGGYACEEEQARKEAKRQSRMDRLLG